ncbi:DEAD/DEAH box helicase family protein [Asticcacaulis sp. EMRT-3]|uniref:DEAD/DEAH box helicase n=1 Tax=Asticcacaulis sp. EMRT-3 TaxID=3040349 RepID=UPI0024AF4716|nr:DEAD/DEAH box helicase family protein [Asticcacaulis sp. EMRT-3]MDI7775598.1 DEAD/DEAH box helicase family protein [Asticcacaulis sp. EMRT-3]
MLRTLDYQDRVLKALDAYLDALNDEKQKADKIAEVAASAGIDIPIPDFAEKTWNRINRPRGHIAYSPRHDGVGRPVPDVVLKVPTGGGKTLLASYGLSRVFGRYLNRTTGFVLWIVPNEAIYTQTLKALSDRQHPYRQVLDRAAAGRVRIMEKTDRLDARDVEGQLCVMLLMLQSANRETQDSLKMFQERGDIHGFFPPEGDQLAHAELLKQVPNLDAYGGTHWALIKDSLGNALRITRPVVVLDEGHKAVSDLAFRTLYGFNPCFVLELTATPHDVQPKGGKDPKAARYANVLVEVSGKELDNEGMIKMPLNLDTRQGTDWHATLNVAVDKLNTLDRDARQLQADSGRYIRPIMLVQAERVGKDQRDSGRIHAEDVREWLMKLGFDEAEIAVKTAETNDLNQPENQDLLSPLNRVRVIITKAALQEGWDCPFAYVLCSLSASSNLRAMTQLAGRILRQPHALKTGVAALDECYIITHHAETATVVSAVKEGLERDGLGDLVVEVNQTTGDAETRPARRIERRGTFKSLHIYLPKVLWVEDGRARDLDYETDVLAAIDWRGFDPAHIADTVPENARSAESQLQKISLTDTPEHFTTTDLTSGAEAMRFDPAYAVRAISDLVPNPFVARDIVGSMLSQLKARGFTADKIAALSGLIVDELRKGLEVERDRRAESRFKALVADGRIQFRLRTDGNNWPMPFTMETVEPENARQLLGKTGGPLERSLFAPVYENELNGEERNVAVHLDSEKTLIWWHRNVARAQYALQGWRRGKIYPDFVFAVQRTGMANRIALLETKGDHLDNGDTAYKRDVLALMSDSFAWDHSVSAGTLELVNEGETVECALILMSDIQTKLPKYLAS